MREIVIDRHLDKHPEPSAVECCQDPEKNRRDLRERRRVQPVDEVLQGSRREL